MTFVNILPADIVRAERIISQMPSGFSDIQFLRKCITVYKTLDADFFAAESITEEFSKSRKKCLFHRQEDLAPLSQFDRIYLLPSLFDKLFIQ